MVLHLAGCYLGMSSGGRWLCVSFFRGRFVKESVLGVMFMGVGVLFGVYFRVFRLYTAPLVCIIISGLCSS